MKNSAALLVLSLILSGCAGMHPSKERMQAISGIKFSGKIDAPEKAFFHGGFSNFSVPGAALNSPALAAVDRPNDVVLTTFLLENKIDVPDMVRSQFIASLRKTVLAAKLKDDGDHILAAKILVFGLGKGAGFANNMRPAITLKVTLTDPRGTTIIDQTELVSGVTTELQARLLEDWMKDPEALRAGYAQAAQIAIDAMLKRYEIQ